MNPFKHYETEKLISICFSDSISKLNSQQLSQLLNELETSLRTFLIQVCQFRFS
jgi:hypothetical protein